MQHIICTVAKFQNKVTGQIIERAKLSQNSTYSSCITPVEYSSIFTDFKKVLNPSPYEAYYKIANNQVTSSSIASLFLIYIDPSVSLKSKPEIECIKSNFCKDLADKLKTLYKPFGFNRKRKTTLELMQECLINDTFDDYCFMYIAKLLKTSIVLKQSSTKQNKPKEWIGYDESASEKESLTIVSKPTPIVLVANNDGTFTCEMKTI